MNKRQFNTPWGKLDTRQFAQFGLLSLVFFLIITSYWALRTLKDPIFVHLVGIKDQPNAKILSVCFILPILFIYAKLVDSMSKKKIFYVFSFFYCIIFAYSAYMIKGPMSTPEIEESSKIIGWIMYVTIESFGSIMVALFWAFATGELTAEEGKKGFPFITFVAQAGSILGPTLVTYSHIIGIVNIVFYAAASIALIPFFLSLYLKMNFSNSGKNKQVSAKKATGIFEGLKLIATNRYVLGIMGISVLHEVVITIMDYKMKFLASGVYPNPNDFAHFMGRYGQAVNFFAFLWAFIGSSWLIRRFGLRFCLLLYPITISVVLCVQYYYTGLWSMFYGVVLFKVLNYSLNNPCKELLYVPTDQDIRYKSKSWIDTFGARACKASGSYVTNLFKHSLSKLSLYGTLFSFGVIAIWIFSGLYVSKEFKKLAQD